MAQVSVYDDRTGNTLTVWFGNPEDEYEVEETGDEVPLMKDIQGKVIGFEKLNFSLFQLGFTPKTEKSYSKFILNHSGVCS